MTARPVQHGPRVELDPCSTRAEPPSVLHVRADYGGRLFTAKLGVVVDYLSHQLLDDRPRHTLQRSEARSRGSVASTVGRVQRFKGSIAQARFQSCEPHTLKAAPAAAILVSESGATGETKKAAQRFSAIGRCLGNRCGMRQDGN